MAELTLDEILRQGLVQSLLGDGSVVVRGIKHDSRRCEPGDLFLAVAGAQSDGAAHLKDALARGAVAVLAERPLTAAVPVLVAGNALLALARIARLLYEDPSAPLTVVGITGTNGKTTTSYLVEAMLHADGAKPAVLGTVNFRGPGGILPATHTTPMADDLMRLCRWAVETEATHLVLEVSSHALAMHRVDGVHFDVAAFTNLTQDHLDYHGDFASYYAAKRRLFSELAPAATVINVDDSHGLAIAEGLSGRCLRCSKRPGPNVDVAARSYSSDRNGVIAEISTPVGDLSLKSPLIGEHNLENLLVALGCGIALGLDTDIMLHALQSAQGAPGRLERISHPEDVLVFVDYAHTPDALSRVLAALRKSTHGRLIVVFGAGGDRDPGKRPLMGRASAEGADLAILTSDNPRSEAPARILAAIELGVRDAGMPPLDSTQLRAAARGYWVEADRRNAIQRAIQAARPGDTVLLAGKGHEKVQIIGDRRLPFDDCVEARAAIAAGSPAGSNGGGG